MSVPLAENYEYNVAPERIAPETVENAVKGSILFDGHDTRFSYLKALVNRLRDVPQLFHGEGYRSRLDHINNGLSIIDKFEQNGAFTHFGLSKDEVKQVRMRFEFHDIGHPRFGHAGERALDTFAARFGSDFSNSTFSVVLQEYQDSSNDLVLNNFGENLFQTEPVVTSRTHSNKVNWLVNYFDDLENVIGDLNDLYKSESTSEVKPVIAQIFGDTDAAYEVILSRFMLTYCKSPDVLSNCFEDRSSACNQAIAYGKDQIQWLREANEKIKVQDSFWFNETMHNIELMYDVLQNEDYPQVYSNNEIARSAQYIVALL